MTVTRPFSVKTAAGGRQPGRPLNLVLLLDNSGSMERADRVRIIQECLRVLAGQLRPGSRERCGFCPDRAALVDGFRARPANFLNASGDSPPRAAPTWKTP
jgi:hypothetical protein